MGVMKACLAREWILVKRNSFVYVFKALQVTAYLSKPAIVIRSIDAVLESGDQGLVIDVSTGSQCTFVPNICLVLKMKLHICIGTSQSWQS